MYIRSLRIQNFRCFEETQIDFQVPGAVAPAAGGARALSNVTLLLGDNGAGKTSLLRSIALAALGPVMAGSSGFVPYSMVRRTRAGTAKRAKVEVTLALQEQDRVKKKVQTSHCELEPNDAFYDRITGFTKSKDLERELFTPFSPSFFVVGYGATRRVESGRLHAQSANKDRTPRYGRVASLFEDHYTLTPLSAWLPRWRTRNPGRHKQVVTLLNQLLSDAELLPEPTEDDEYLFRHRGSDVPFAALSDGYRAFIGWAADLLYQVSLTCPDGQKLVDNHGVVLLDEVDLHLHPAWQRTLAPTLARVLPNIQFIITSHSPLITGTLGAANVRILRSRSDAQGIPSVSVEPATEELYGMSADQILTSRTFGLDSARDAEFTVKLRDAAARARDGHAGAALQVMRMLSGGAAATDATPPPNAPGAATGTKGRGR